MSRSIRFIQTAAIAAFTVATLTAQGPAMQGDGAAHVRTMAGILAKLNHYPSDAEKKSLQAIVDDKTAGANEKTLAQALINVQHTVSPADKPKVEALAKDATASAPLKTLAGVLVGLNHTASAAEKDTLAKLAAAK
jgi:hypothetical protein